MNCDYGTYVHHYAVTTAKARNESPACRSVITYESATVSAVMSLALDGSPGISQIYKIIQDTPSYRYN